MRDIRVMLKAGWVVVDVSHSDEHAGGTGERPGGPSIRGNHHQRVVALCLPVQQRAGDDLPRGRVDGELGVSTDDPVTKAESRDGHSPSSYHIVASVL